jgi:hypothetical protein
VRATLAGVHTNALRKAAVARKAVEATEAPAAEPEPAPEVAIELADEAQEPQAAATRKARRAKAVETESAAMEADAA